MTYQWAKIELLGHRVRYGRCSVVDFLGTQMLRIEVPFAEPKIVDKPRYIHSFRDLAACTDNFLLEQFKTTFPDATTIPATREELLDQLGDAHLIEKVEQFQSVEEYAPAALYGRTILTEAEVRKALEPWKPEPLPALPYRTNAIRDWEDSAPLDVEFQSPTEQRLIKIASANWSEHDLPGWRIISLASVGFRGVGRPDAAKRCDEDADYFKTDAEAMRYLAGFQWNELADLPFLIRDLLGIDEHGNWVDADDDGECPWLVDPLPGQGVSKAMREVFTVDGDEDAVALGVTAVRETERPAKPLYKATTCDNGKTWSYEFHDVDGDKMIVRAPQIRVTSSDAIAELMVDANGPTLDVWCPNYAQLETFHNRIGDILAGHKVTATAIEQPKTSEPSHKYNRAWLSEQSNDTLETLYVDNVGFFDMNGTCFERENMIETLAGIEGEPPATNEGYETTREKVDEAVARNCQQLSTAHERVLRAIYAREFGESGNNLTGIDILNVFSAITDGLEMNDNCETISKNVADAMERNHNTVNVTQRGTVILANGNKATLHDGAITEHGNDGPVRPKYTREWLDAQKADPLRLLFEKEFQCNSEPFLLSVIKDRLASLIDNNETSS